MGEVNQDDIDKMLQSAMSGGDDAPAPAPAAPAADITFEGAASQDDIDAMFAAAGTDPAPAEPQPASASAPTPPAPAPEPEITLDGVASQDDIDALFSAGIPAAAPAAAAPAPQPDPDLEGVANQDDIDALFSAVDSAGGAPAAPEPVADSGPADQADIDALFSAIDSVEGDTPPPAPDSLDIDQELAAIDADAGSPAEDAADDGGLDELLSSIATDHAGVPAEPAVAAAGDNLDDFDMDALLREVAEAAPPAPPPRPEPEKTADSTQALSDTAVMSPEVSTRLAQAEAHQLDAPPPAAPVPVAPVPAAAPLPSLPQLPAGAIAEAAAARREFSVLYGAGEVESVANQINALLNAMSEKAAGYMQAWIAADSEAKELRARALAEERRRVSMESEKAALGHQVDDLRQRLGDLEGGKIASEESRRTLETSFQAKIRELESQVKLLSSEAEALKDELTRARNQATGVDIESRRARFEADRLKNEVESERMERLRIQRALENREKEIQAMQSQAGGQASSLFIDELHRLVRRLETELEVRTSGAHEALRQLDRLEPSENMVPVAANLRAALLQALGRDADADDALKTLGRDAGGVQGGLAVRPQKAEMISFESALSTYNLVGAMDVAGTLLREASATPPALMRKIYQCPALRRPEVADHIGDLARLLEGLRTVQEANDRARGVEAAEAEVFYVHLFDFLHNLVKMKIINRLSGDIWRLFLDLRGRFSFVTSDKQWAEFRDNTLRLG